MTAVLIFATILAPIILAVTELFKRTFTLPKTIIPLIAFAVGLFIGFAASPFTELDIVLRLWAGGLAGLAATGIFELGTPNEGKTKGAN
ncbi:holin [Sporosarcina sp. SAFN-010]|uniref:holin n=1 Tax=Sporosarcina sp. SAFN-010 TaxID=3387273 RepID=UPI003F81EABD